MNKSIEEALEHQHCILQVGPGVDGIRVVRPDGQEIADVHYMVIRIDPLPGHDPVQVYVRPPGGDAYEIEFRSATVALQGDAREIRFRASDEPIELGRFPHTHVSIDRTTDTAKVAAGDQVFEVTSLLAFRGKAEFRPNSDDGDYITEMVEFYAPLPKEQTDD